MPVAAVRVAQSAPARAVTRGSPKRSAGVLRPSASADGCAIRSKAGLARTVAWPGARLPYAPADGAGLVLELGEVGQAGVAAEVAGRVDDGLDPQGAALLEVLLDPGVLVEDVR